MQSFIFDFNGTLYPDKEIHRMAWTRFMTERGLRFTDEEFDRYIYGPANDAVIHHFMGDGLPDREVDRLSREKEAIYRQIAMDNPGLQGLTPGAEEMLDTLRRRGVPYAIATGSLPENVDFYFETLGIGKWFDRDHVFFEEGGLPGKPDPAIYRQAMRKLGYAPGEVTVVEDSLAGIRSAVGAGAGRVIAIDTTLGPDAFRGIGQVRAVIHDFFGFERFIEPQEEKRAILA